MKRMSDGIFEHQNETLIRNLFEGFSKGDAAKVYTAIAEDAVWHFPGRKNQLAGDHQGREAIFAFLSKIPALSGGKFKVDLADVLANDENAVALFRGMGERNGVKLDNPTCLRMRIKDGKIVEFWEFVWNLDKVEEFWA
jgi:ketosteroid isomerase-like protein